ncbi:MAG TPA: DUF4258 domain-containing protein [Chloroflexi bacterium]|nr:DUF4258 domain-containing protein [Chloroflexota bacterium]
MYVQDTEDLLEFWSELRVSVHALREAYKEGLRGRDILYAIFKGQVIEWYPERNRVLIRGPIPQTDVPLHVACDYRDYEELVVVTVYIPNPPQWPAHLAKRHRHAK